MTQGDRIAFFISLLLVIGLILIAGFLRFRKRENKTQVEINRAKKLSWIIYFFAMAFFLVTILYFNIKINS